MAFKTDRPCIVLLALYLSLTYLGVQTQASAAGPSSSQTPQASQPGQQPQQQIPTNIAAGAGAFNPFAGLTGARYAGQMPGLPNMSMFGPDRTARNSHPSLTPLAANALPPSTEQMQEMMNQVCPFSTVELTWCLARIPGDDEPVARRPAND
jgi:hypothetical protein